MQQTTRNGWRRRHESATRALGRIRSFRLGREGIEADGREAARWSRTEASSASVNSAGGGEQQGSQQEGDLGTTNEQTPHEKVTSSVARRDLCRCRGRARSVTTRATLHGAAGGRGPDGAVPGSFSCREAFGRARRIGLRASGKPPVWGTSSGPIASSRISPRTPFPPCHRGLHSTRSS